jgi:hypothetical protein
MNRLCGHELDFGAFSFGILGRVTARYGTGRPARKSPRFYAEAFRAVTRYMEQGGWARPESDQCCSSRVFVPVWGEESMHLLTRLAHIIPEFHERAIRIKQYL